MSETLKPCPFCGSTNVAIRKDVHGNLLWWGECQECDSSTGTRDTADQAVAVWNTRAESADLTAAQAEIGLLKSANSDVRRIADEREALTTEISIVQAKLTAAQDACQRRDEVIEWLTNVLSREEQQSCPETPTSPCHEFGTCSLEIYETCLRGKIAAKLKEGAK
jgi:Lar family restriction alleviation protein